MRYLFVFLFQICTLVSFAQTAVSGVVSDKKGVPLAYANVMVYRSADTTYIDGAVTDDAGRFEMSVPPTPCLLRVSCLGYNDCWSSALSDNMHIQLDSAAYMMDEAVVSARRPTFSMTGEGIVTNVAGTLLGKMGTAETVLSRIPSVVEKDGAWEVFGKGTPVIYLNGHVLQDMNELKNIKASDVKNVEVVTAPGAKYSASVRAVIKIKTIRLQGEGLSLDTYTNYRYNRFGNFAQSVVGNYRHGKLDAFATYEYSTSRGYSDQRFEQTVAADTLWRINTDNYYSGRTAWHYLQGGLYYDFTSDQSVGVKYSTTISGNEYMKGWLRSDALADGDLYDHTSTGMRQHNSDRPSQYLNVYYAGKIGATSVEFDNDYYFEHSIYDTYNKEVSETHDSREVDTRNSSRSSMAAWKLDMETPILDGALSYGAEYINTHRKDAYSSNMKNVVDDASSKIEESSLCPYLEYGWSGKIGNLKGGLRYEFVKFKYYENNVYMPGQSKDYHNFFPSLSYGKSLGNLSLQVGYSAKTTRPNYTQLSNNISYANRFLRQSGNPLLRHQTDHTVSLSAVWKFVQMALEYKDVRNAIMRMSEIPILDFENEWTSKYIELFCRDIKRLKLCGDSNLLYDSGKYFHNAMKYPKETIPDSCKYSFPTYILNHNTDREGALYIFLDEYINGSYNLTLGYEGQPPLEWMITNFNMLNADVCSEKQLAIWLNIFVHDACYVISSNYNRKKPEDVIFLSPSIDDIEIMEDLYYSALLNLHSIYS